MKRSLPLVLMPLWLAAAIALPVAAPGLPSEGAAASPRATRFEALPRALEAALHDAVPGAAANGVHLIALEHGSLGIGDWQRVSGTARVGSGATAATLRFSGRFDAGAGQVEALRLRWSAPVAVPVDGLARVAIERAARAELVAEFPEQAPAFELVSLVRRPAVGDATSNRVFHGRGRIDFGAEGTVLAPVEVVLDDDARVVALRYSLDELDPAPFDGAPLGETERLAVR